MEALVLLGRNYREKIKVKAKIPLRSMKIIQRDKKVLENLKRFEPYFQDELNIKKIEYVSNEDDFVQVSAKADFKALGPRLGQKMKAVAAGIQKLALSELLKLEAGGSVTIEGESVTLADMQIVRAPKGDNPNLVTHQLVSIDVDPTYGEEEIREGLAREIIRKVQATRKAADFQLDDRIALEIECDGVLLQAAQAHEEMIKTETLAKTLKLGAGPSGKHVEEVELEEGKIRIGVTALPRK